jgi:hypothetical protein
MQLYHLRHQVSVLAQESQTYGTVFSGTDGFGHMLEVLSEVWKELFDLVVEFKQMFACDNNPRVQEYLKSQLDKDILIFPDIVQLVAGVDAMELRSHKCTLCYALFAMHSLLCTLCCALFAVHSLLCTLCYALFAMHSLLRTLCYALFAMHSLLWMPYVASVAALRFQALAPGRGSPQI